MTYCVLSGVLSSAVSLTLIPLVLSHCQFNVRKCIHSVKNPAAAVVLIQRPILHCN